MSTEIRSAFDPPVRVSIVFPNDGMTKQASKDETDINLIMAKFIKTGTIEHANRYQGSYGDATSADYHESLNILHEADRMFGELPAAARAKFRNDPSEFLDFVQNPENESQLFSLGLTQYPFEEPADPPADPPTPPVS